MTGQVLASGQRRSERGSRASRRAQRRVAGPDVASRAAALEEALDAADGRLSETVLRRGREVVAQARTRAALSAEHTVVALAGATGSGKSSLLNALVGQQVAQPGVLRPTTSRPTAAVWGPPADALLDWLDVTVRHRVGSAARPDGDAPALTTPDTNTAAPSADSPAPVAGASATGVGPVDESAGLVVLDLPDHDSVVVEHRMIAEQLVERVDLLVWVLDPQKYADGVLHERFLRPLARHVGVMVLVLNQVDRLTPQQTAECLADLTRLADADGLAGVRILAVSARTGQGVGALREFLAEAARKREAATARLVTGIQQVGEELVRACGERTPATERARADVVLVDALEGAAGIHTITDAVRARAKLRARASTGWPPLRWVSRFRVDPLRRLNLHKGPADAALNRTSLPAPGGSQLARAQVAVRAYSAAVTAGVPDEWVLAARDRVARESADLADQLDSAVAATELEADRAPVWWRVVNAWQWLLVTVMLAGLVWLGVLAGFDYFHLPVPSTPDLWRIPWPTALALGGLLLGVVTSLLARAAAAIGARRQAARARTRLRASIEDVALRAIRSPLQAELDALAHCRVAALVASRR